MEYRLGPNAAAPEIHATLDRFGVAVIEDFLPAAHVELLREEVARLLAGDPAPGQKQQFDAVFTKSRKTAWGGFDWSPYPGVRRAVDDPRVAEILAYREYDGPFPEYIISQRSVGRFDEADELPPQYGMHTDGIQAHRFMYYLTDVNGPEDGALTMVPGAYQKYKAWRDRQRDKGRKSGSRYLMVPELEGQGVPLTGRAGTLVTFFTDSPHKAGIVAPEHERVIFRINAGNFAVQSPSMGSRFSRSVKRFLGEAGGN